MTNQFSAKHRGDADSADQGNVDPGAELVLLILGGDIGEPAPKSCRGEHCRPRAQHNGGCEDGEVIEVQDGDDHHSRFERSEGGGIPSPAEAHVKNGTEGDAEEIWREGSRSHEGDSRLRHMAGRE